jgi:TMEM199 family protein
MARLRRKEEERSYHRMTNPAPPMETFAQRFPLSSAAHAFASSHQPINSADQDDDDATYEDVNRQVTLIFNVLVSIVACAGAIWVVARWWATPARLAVSLGGSLLVGVAEVVVYSGYIRRVSEAKKKERSVKEVKEVVKTWVVDAGEEADEDDIGAKESSVKEKQEDGNFKARRRKKDAK